MSTAMRPQDVSTKPTTPDIEIAAPSSENHRNSQYCRICEACKALLTKATELAGKARLTP